MASNFVPMLSSSPPPLDDCPDDDDDDFGNFASANIPFDSSFDSPVATSKHKSFKPGDNGVNDLNLSNDFNTICSNGEPEFSNHMNDSLKKSKNINAHIDKQSTCDVNELTFSKTPNDVSVVKNESSDPNLSVNSFQCDFSSGLNPVNSLKKEETPLKLSSCENIDDKSDDLSDSELTPSEEILDDNKLSIDSNSSSRLNNPCGLFNNSFYSDCDAKTDEAQNSDISFECFKENICVPENLEFSVNKDEFSENIEYPDEGNFVTPKLELPTGGSDFDSENLNFHADFSAAEDDFDDFQQAVSNQAQTTETNSDNASNNSLSQSKNGDEFRTDINDSNDDDDFDDFKGFDKASSACVVSNSVTETDSRSIDDDDEFQDFKKCEQIEDDVEEFDDFQACAVSENSSIHEFANFESVSFDEKAQSDSPQFADFESASFSSDETRSNFACATSSSAQDKIATVLSAIFPPESESSEEYCDQPAEILEQSNKSHRLWEKLHEVEQAPSLRFQWGVSHSFQQLLRSVNVDYHSILRTSSVPIFASSLSLLEPVKGQTKTVNAESEDRKKVQSVNECIPPVEFDWTSSGLVNPLDSVQVASVLMDLSFLATSSDSAPSNDSHSFENELLKPSPPPSCSESLNKTLILEELLSKNVCSLPNSNITHRPPNISEEANSVLDQLPDLSFMRAKVLMFPISSKT